MRHECWTIQGSLSCSPWQSVCHNWTATDGTHNCMPGCESILAVTAGWLMCVCVCVDFVYVVSEAEISCMVVFIYEEFLNLLQRYWVKRTGPIPWHRRSCDFTLVDIFWSNVTEHIYIPPSCILLMEGHTEIEQLLRLAIFWDCTQHKVVIPFRRFGINSRSHLQGSRCLSTTCLDSRQPAHTGCLLEELTVTELI